MCPTGSKHWQNGEDNDMQSDECRATSTAVLRGVGMEILKISERRGRGGALC